jgi:hypothetical protein
MRVLSQPVFTYSVTLTTSLQQQNTKLVPFFGAVAGFWLDLTVTIASGTHSQASNSIDNVIQQFELDDAFGKVAIQVPGTDLSPINDTLQPQGVRTSPPTITTDSSGNGSAEWHFFFPYTIAVGDSPAQLKVTFNSTSSLQNGSLTSAGTATVVFNVRAAYLVGLDAPTLRTTTANPFHQQGDNNMGNYLPAGFQEEIFMFTLAGGDGDFGYLTQFQAGGTFAVQSPLNDFKDADTMLMRSGHLSGEFITRIPVFIVDNTSMVTINLSTDTAVRFYNIATVPQAQRKA